MNLIVSYAHSADFWVRYMVEYTTKKPTTGPEPEDRPIGELYALNVDVSAEPILESKRSVELFDTSSKAIFLVRNYRDIFVRRTYEKVGDKDFLEKTYFEEGYDQYMSIIRAYDDWDHDKRHLVYFEDLMDNPEIEIPKIFKFLDIDNKDSNEFMSNYERHFRCCLGIFRRGFPGGDLTIYPGSVAKSIKVYMDEIMMYNSPILFGKYLSRYIS